MKQLIYIFLAIIISSCSWLIKESPDQEILLNEEIGKINWSQVDQFPSLIDCDSINDTELEKKCLYEKLSHTIKNKLENKTFVINSLESDTIWVALTINTDSTVTITPDLSALNDATAKQQLDSLITQHLDSLPKISPAVKRGVLVKSQLNIPIALNKK
nr:hypothetical protein [uncultured Flavobacterium sp.]